MRRRAAARAAEAALAASRLCSPQALAYISTMGLGLGL